MTDKTLFTPSEFQSRMKDGGRVAATAPFPPLTAFIKESELGEGYFQIAVQSCESWVDLPHSLIESIEHLRDGHCGDHHHPIVVITFKPIENPETLAVIALMTHAMKATLGQQASTRKRPAAKGAASAETDGPEGRRSWFYCILHGFETGECIECLNNCEALEDHAARQRCLARCCC